MKNKINCFFGFHDSVEMEATKEQKEIFKKCTPEFKKFFAQKKTIWIPNKEYFIENIICINCKKIITNTPVEEIEKWLSHFNERQEKAKIILEKTNEKEGQGKLSLMDKNPEK